MTSETMRLDDFSTGGIWDAEAHVRFLRSSAGAPSGFTADLIEQLYSALTATRPDTGDHIADAGKMVGKAGMTNPSETRDSELAAARDAFAKLDAGLKLAAIGGPNTKPGNARRTLAKLLLPYLNDIEKVLTAADAIDRLTSTGEAGLDPRTLDDAKYDRFRDLFERGRAAGGFNGETENLIRELTNAMRDAANWRYETTIALQIETARANKAEAASPREGHVEVPVEPTEAMLARGADVYDGDMNKFARAYRAMLAALPHNETKP